MHGMTNLQHRILGFVGLCLTVSAVSAAEAETVLEFRFDSETTVPDVGTGTVSFGPGIHTEAFTGGVDGLWSYSAQGWSTADLDPDDYLQVTVDSTGYAALQFSFTERRAPASVLAFLVQYSTDGIEFYELPGSDSVIADESHWIERNFDLTTTIGVNDNPSLVLRIFGFSSEIDSGAWRFDDVIVTGEPLTSQSFVDVTNDAGVAFIHWDVDELDPDYENGMFRMMGGAAAADFDGDGWTDLYMTRIKEPNVLFRNLKDGTFEEVGAAAGVDFSGESTGCAWGDVNNDGFPDLYLLTLESRNYLYINNGDGTFTEEAIARGVDVPPVVGQRHNSTGAAFTDFDLDGDLDLFVTEWVGNPSQPADQPLNRLFSNDGTGHFVDVTASALLDVSGLRGFSPGFTDIDGDNYPDLLVAGDFGTTQMFRNLGDGTFADITDPAVVTDENGMGAAIGDVDGDGSPDWFVTAIYDPDETCMSGGCGWGSLGNRMYHNDGGAVFTDVTDATGVRAGFWGWGASFLDFDNDGDLDLTHATGQVFIGNPLVEPFNVTPARLWANYDGVMSEVAEAYGFVESASSKGLVVFDYDRDGDQDVFIVNNAAMPVLFQNVGGNSSGDWLQVVLRGHETNYFGIGTKVTVEVVEGGSIQVREMTANSNYLSQNEPVLHFGLGPDATSVFSVTVDWPVSGRVQVLNDVFPNQRIMFDELAPLFADVTTDMGVEFTLGDVPLNFACFGSGAGWADYDNDGDPDLYLTNREGPNKFFENNYPDPFVDRTVEFGLEFPDDIGGGVLWGDYDNDGDPDLYVGTAEGNRLMRNDGSDGQGGWTFTDVTAEAGVAGEGRTTTAVYGDYNNDGWLDLYVANHTAGPVGPSVGGPTYSDKLYKNVPGPGDTRVFQDVTEDIFPTDYLYFSAAHSAGFLDYDNDHDLDIVVVNESFDNSQDEFKPMTLWRNDGSDGAGGWIYTEVGVAAGVDHVGHPMGLAIGDYDGNGWLDFSVSDAGPNHLYRNNGDNTFTDVGVDAGIDRAKIVGAEGGGMQISWGVSMQDFNGDGLQDLYVAAGRCNNNIGTFQPNPLFTNLNGASFADVSLLSGADGPGRGHTTASADFDGDLDVDLFVVDYTEKTILYENVSLPQSYLTLKLIGTVSNRDAVGARVMITAPGLPDQHYMVQSGSSHGGSNELELHIGLLDAATADVTIEWPSGGKQTISDIAANTQLVIVEPAFGDSEGDGDRDLRDQQAFQSCYTGSCAPACDPLPAGCDLMDFDSDGDVDTDDHWRFVIGFAGPE